MQHFDYLIIPLMGYKCSFPDDAWVYLKEDESSRDLLIQSEIPDKIVNVPIEEAAWEQYERLDHTG